MKCTSVFSKNIHWYNEGKRIIVNKGSSRSGKTYSILQLLYFIAYKSDSPLVISVVSESMPHLKKGAIRQLTEMLKEEGVWNDRDFNKTDSILRVNKSIIEFFSADTSGKVHGPERDILFINECINVDYEIFRQLDIRTRGTIMLDYNPCHEFWVDEKVLPLDYSALIHSTYKDNECLSDNQVRAIESNRHDKNWWDVYGLGITGSKEGLIFTNWAIVSDMPKDFKKRYIGVDFGFTNDPTAIYLVILQDGQLWIDELMHSVGMSNREISECIKNNKFDLVRIIADSAEPKSIAELTNARLFVEGAEKGSDSINQGISVLQSYKLNVTSRSTELIKELRNYKWQTNRDGKSVNKPIDKFNHAIDAIRYVALNKLSKHKVSYSGLTGKVFQI